MHGTFIDTLAINPAFLRRLESLFPGPRLPRRHRHAAQPRHVVHQVRPRRGADDRPDQPLQHDVRPVLHGRQSGRLRARADAATKSKQLLDDAISIKPRRQMTVQFSGGEPTISPIFLDAVRYARKVGYFSVQAATNGIRFAQDAGVRARRRTRPGMRIAYLQFDGVTEEANAHRKVGNLFDVKLRAIENLLRRRHRRLPRRDHRQHRQRRPGRADRQVRAAELRQDQLRVVPAGVVHRPRRGDRRRGAARASATRCRISPRT